LQTKYKKLNVQGYSFDITTSDYADKTNTVSLDVKTSSDQSDHLSYFILGVPSDEIEALAKTQIISFDKKSEGTEYADQSVCKIMQVDDDDIPLIGLRIDDNLFTDQKKTYNYHLKLSNRLDFFALGVKLNESIYIMEVEKDMENNEMIVTETKPEETKTTAPAKTETVVAPTIPKAASKHRPKKAICLPACMDFCLYFIIPECYSICSLEDAKVSVFKKCLFIEENSQSESVKVCTPCGNVYSKCTIYKDILNGSVKINASLPIKNDEACDEYAEVCADECFCIDEVIGYFSRPKSISLDKISICPDYKSLDITVLNECSGKKAVRLDGKLIITLKDC
jgi:hypothetical protein